MLIRNCETDLFRRGDFNVRVSLFEKKKKYYLPFAYKEDWINTIRSCLGNGNLSSTEILSFSVSQTGKDKPALFKGTFSMLVENLERCSCEPTSIRIDLFSKPNRSWIILIPEECKC